MARTHHSAIRFSLATLLVVMLLLNLAIAYVTVVGMWAVVMALGPPLAIAGVLRGVIGEFDRPGQFHREDLRVLVCLVVGFAVWLPVLIGRYLGS
jgi:hypothetical protein